MIQYEVAAKNAGFSLTLTPAGRYVWLAPDGKTRGKERHSTQDEAWEECFESNGLAAPTK